MWRTVPALMRLNLSLVVAFSTLTGFVCFRRAIDLDACVAFAGVFFLACAASALNQHQERNFDALMDRTKKRPLPMRQIERSFVLSLTVLFALTGLSILYFRSSPRAALLAAVTLLWYNGVYTPLKRKTRFAVLIGACTGALPPLIGYTAAGGSIISTCLAISLFMFLWQVSHFQLLLVKYGREYESAGFAAMVSITNEKGVRISVFSWMMLAACSAFALLAFHIVSGFWPSAILIAGSALLPLYFYKKMVCYRETLNFGPLFRSIYSYQGAILAMVVVTATLYPH